jgi:hypothetical protein
MLQRRQPSWLCCAAGLLLLRKGLPQHRCCSIVLLHIVVTAMEGFTEACASTVPHRWRSLLLLLCLQASPVFVPERLYIVHMYLTVVFAV